jgi:hypothetical protein
MRKTMPRARKQDPASSFDKMGLIAKKQRRQSAKAEPVLDNRSHRTPRGSAASFSSARIHQRAIFSPATARLEPSARLLHPPVRQPMSAMCHAFQ